MCAISLNIHAYSVWTDHRPPVSPTLSPERLTLLLQGQTHACVAVGLPACTGCAVYQIEISWTRFCSAITVFWKVTWSRRGTTKHTGALQLHRQRERDIKLIIKNNWKSWCQSWYDIITAKLKQFCYILNTMWYCTKRGWYKLGQCPHNYGSDSLNSSFILSWNVT